MILLYIIELLIFELTIISSTFEVSTTADAPKSERILEEALSLFAQRGYDGTGVDLIAKHVGIKGPSLYKHFTGKEDIMNLQIGFSALRLWQLCEIQPKGIIRIFFLIQSLVWCMVRVKPEKRVFLKHCRK